MSITNTASIFKCPVCGLINKDNIKIYNESLRKQSFKISPILPTCLFCGSQITLSGNNINNSDRKIIVLTGTCGSGKSSTAEILMEKYNFSIIDGDCVMQVIKHKLGINKIEFNEPLMYKEIETQIDVLLSLDKDIVISHVITPGDIHVYSKILRNRVLNYKIFLLKPNYESALARTKTRTCHNSTTPEEWVKYFYDKLNAFEKQNSEDVIIFDNSNYSVEESADKVLQIFG